MVGHRTVGDILGETAVSIVVGQRLPEASVVKPATYSWFSGSCSVAEMIVLLLLLAAASLRIFGEAVRTPTAG